MSSCQIRLYDTGAKWDKMHKVKSNSDHKCGSYMLHEIICIYVTAVLLERRDITIGNLSIKAVFHLPKSSSINRQPEFITCNILFQMEIQFKNSC